MKKSKLVSISVCLITTIIVYSYLCVVISPKSINDTGGKNFYGGAGFAAEPKGTVDILIYGNSDVYAGVIPALIYKNYGYTSYASGKAMQTIEGINRLLCRTLKKQKPKVVVLEVDCLYEEDKYSFSASNLMIAPFIYHARWKELKIRDFFTFPDRSKMYDITKGYAYSKEICNNKRVNYMGDKNSKPQMISKKNRKQLDCFINTCRENNIKIVFLELPSASSWNYAKSNAIREIAKSKRIPFVDLNIDKDRYAVNFARDFRDEGNHLNIFGAKKATKYMAEFLAHKFRTILVDKRNKGEYYNWNEAIKHYEVLAKKSDM